LFANGRITARRGRFKWRRERVTSEGEKNGKKFTRLTEEQVVALGADAGAGQDEEAVRGREG
jgi:hypothetical protein